MTERVKTAAAERIKEATEHLIGSTDPELDRFLKGMIHAYREIIDMEIEPDYNEEPDEVSARDAG